MLVTFKSKAASDVLMVGEHARRILELLGKDVQRGVLVQAELPSAIQRIEEEIEHQRLLASDDIVQDVALHQSEKNEDHEHEQVQAVSFGTRVYPLLEMLRAAQRQDQVVAWGI